MRFALATICLILIAGCGPKEPTVISEPNETERVVADSGKSPDQAKPVPDEKATIKSDDGAEVTFTEGGAKGVDENGNKVEIGPDVVVTEKEIGVEFYPNSKDGKENMKYAEGGKPAYISVRTTKDSVAKVTAFYKSKLSSVETGEAGTIATVKGTSSDGRKVVVTMVQMKGFTRISVSTGG